MGKKSFESTGLDRARDELFSHIQRCGVLAAEPEQREEWLGDTIDFLAERYPELTASELEELRVIGRRYCSPAIPHGNATAKDVHGGLGEAPTQDEPAGETPGGPVPEPADPLSEPVPVEAGDEERSEVGAA